MKCQFEDCMTDATKTWALLPLCSEHHEIIRLETKKYYSNLDRIPEPSQRPQYYKIDLRIACSKRNLKIKRGETI